MLNNQPIEKAVKGDGKTLDLHSIFYTIQGEGPFCGMPAVFIRLAGCNLQCPWCFGWRGNLRQPFVYMANGPKKRMGNVVEGDRILTLDDDGNMAETTVQKVLRREVNEWVEIDIAGRGQYAVTPEHPFFTNRGMVPAGELIAGDEILHSEPEDVISWKKLGDRNPMKDPETAARSAKNTDYTASGKKIAAAVARRKAEGLSWGGPISEEGRLAIGEANSGRKNGNAKDDTPENFLRLKREIKKGLHSCSSRSCNTPESRLEVHHIDYDGDNDDPSNLSVLCHACHSKHHMRGYNFWTKDQRTDGKSSETARDVYNGLRVNKIKRVKHDPERDRSWPSSPGPKPLTVTNFDCWPHKTFLADGMWVHNCDTEYTQGRSIQTAEYIATEVLRAGPRGCLVVITGGEPFRQPIGRLIAALVDQGNPVQVETNGSLPPPDLTEFDLLWETKPTQPLRGAYIVCSPKSGKVNQKVVDRSCCFKYVMDIDAVDEEDGLPTTALGHTANPRLARPPSWWDRPIYLQPADHKDPVANQANIEAVVKSATKHGYTVQLQIHKYLGME